MARKGRDHPKLSSRQDTECAVEQSQVMQESKLRPSELLWLQKESVWSRLRGLWQRPERVTGYQTESVRTDRPVRLEKDAILVGHVVAPQVTVTGFLFGYVVAREVVVKAGGQIWGDVFARSWQIEEGGVIHGWSSTPGEEVLAALAEGRLPAEWPAVALPEGVLPPELMEQEPDPAGRVAMLHHLQTEIAAALVARAELERTFDERVAEIAGDAFAELESVEEQRAAEQQELVGLEAEMQELALALQQREEAFEQVHGELEETRAMLGEKTEALQELQVLFGQKAAELGRVQAANELLEEQMQDSIMRADAYTGRIENLESALQASLQRTAEQEEALLRWQELAEVTQMRVRELQGEVDAAQMQLAESERVIGRLREQRSRIEGAWQETVAELERMKRVRAGWEEEEADEEAVSAGDGRQLAELRQALGEAQKAVQQQQEEMLWQAATLKTANATVERLEQELLGRDEKLASLQEGLRKQQQVVENWKNKIGRMSEVLYAAEQRAVRAEERVAAQKTELQQNQRVFEAEYRALKDQMQQQKVQLEAMEQELEHYYGELHRQGQRISELQVELVEKHVEGEEARALLAERTQERERIRQAATKRIRTLESELARVQRQLTDLMAWVERRRGKEKE